LTVLFFGGDTQEQLTKRLQELKAEFETGQTKLAEIEGEANNLRSTMLRISGAIQVLEEELAKANGSTSSADADVETKADTRSAKT
jgi:predicted nuclease with TOPRIM domain